ncbi:hypothetical protein BHE74_00033436 [Ensete ventricosum]|nr:hypothetical protein BHE74_00033436 [Ensete ventricosum]
MGGVTRLRLAVVELRLPSCSALDEGAVMCEGRRTAEHDLYGKIGGRWRQEWPPLLASEEEWLGHSPRPQRAIAPYGNAGGTNIDHRRHPSKPKRVICQR